MTQDKIITDVITAENVRRWFQLLCGFNEEEMKKDVLKIIEYQCTLPEIYQNQLNADRIIEYKKIAEEYNIDELIIGTIFSKGADWYKSVMNIYAEHIWDAACEQNTKLINK
jgi:hypothetical protein